MIRDIAFWEQRAYDMACLITKYREALEALDRICSDTIQRKIITRALSLEEPICASEGCDKLKAAHEVALAYQKMKLAESDKQALKRELDKGKDNDTL